MQLSDYLSLRKALPRSNQAVSEPNTQELCILYDNDVTAKFKGAVRF